MVPIPIRGISLNGWIILITPAERKWLYLELVIWKFKCLNTAPQSVLGSGFRANIAIVQDKMKYKLKQIKFHFKAGHRAKKLLFELKCVNEENIILKWRKQMLKKKKSSNGKLIGSSLIAGVKKFTWKLQLSNFFKVCGRFCLHGHWECWHRTLRFCLESDSI